MARKGAGLVQIANPTVVEKIEALVRATGLNRTAAVEKAVDNLLSELQRVAVWERFDEILREIDRLPERDLSSDPLEWDENGLPR